MSRRTRKTQTAKRRPQATSSKSAPRRSNPLQGAELLREYVAGSSLLTGTALRALPQTIDDVTREVGSDTYDRMLNDPEVSSDVWLLKYFVLADGYQVSPAVAEGDKRYNLAKEISDAFERCLTNLQRPFLEVLEEMLDALSFGNKVAEQVYEIPTEGKDANRLMLKALKVKPRKAIGFVVDAFMNLLGFIYARPNSMSVTQASAIVDQSVILPREKFAVLTLRPKDEDPRGQSSLRAAYNAWNLKTQTWPELLRWLLIYAVSGLIGFTAKDADDEELLDENNEPVLDSDGKARYVTAQEAMLSRLEQFRGGMCAVFPDGSSVDQVEAKSDGTPFEKFIELFDKQIGKGILFQTLATGEGKRQARAASETHKDVLDKVVWWLKGKVAAMITNDIAKPFVRYNWGDGAAKELLPKITLGSMEKPSELTPEGVAALETSGYLGESQKPGVDTKLGLPKRDPKIDREAKAAAQPPSSNPKLDQKVKEAVA